MKKSLSIAISATTVLAFSITSCKKINPHPDTKQTATETVTETEKNVTHISGIGSNDGYPYDNQTNLARYQMYGTSIGLLATVTNYFGGTATSTDPNGVKGYAYCQGRAIGQGFDVYAYKYGGVNYMNIGGSENPILNGSNTGYATFTIDEIEMDPTNSQYVYILCKEGNGMRIYRYDIYSGLTDAMIYEYSPGLTKYDLFQNVSGNGYKSGSITFVKGTTANPNAYRLVFTHESTVYSSYGIVTNHFVITGTTIKPEASYNKTYSTATSGIPGAQTGKLNTAFGDDIFYISRDGGNLYSLDINNSNTAATLILSSSQFNNKYDFSYYDNYIH